LVRDEISRWDVHLIDLLPFALPLRHLGTRVLVWRMCTTRQWRLYETTSHFTKLSQMSETTLPIVCIT
jgi:hypothetical protein